MQAGEASALVAELEGILEGESAAEEMNVKVLLMERDAMQAELDAVKTEHVLMHTEYEALQVEKEDDAKLVQELKQECAQLQEKVDPN